MSGERNFSAPVMRGHAYPMVASRQVADYFLFDGVNHTNSSLVWPAGKTECIIGTSDFMVVVPLFAANIGVSKPIVAIGDSAGPNHNTLYLRTHHSLNAMLRLQAILSWPTSSYADISIPGWGSAMSGRGVMYLRRIGTTVSLWWNDSKVMENTHAGWGIDLASSAICFGRDQNSNSFAGPMGAPRIYNAAWSDAEIIEHARSGTWPAWGETAVGSMTVRTVTARSFSPGVADANNTTDTGGGSSSRTVEAGARTGGAGSYFLRGTMAGGSSNSMYAGDTIGPIANRVWVRGWLRCSEAGTYSVSLGSGAGRDLAAAVQLPVFAPNVWTPFSVTLASSGATGVPTRIYLNAVTNPGAGATLDLDDLEWGYVGPFFRPIVRSSRRILDLGANAFTGVVGSAVTPVSSRRDWTAGEVRLFAGSTAPTGWAICDGSAFSRSSYADLFAAIGTTFGAGDGATTFNLPTLPATAGVNYIIALG